jgi:hypothetical protein
MCVEYTGEGVVLIEPAPRRAGRHPYRARPAARRGRGVRSARRAGDYCGSAIL